MRSCFADFTNVWDVMSHNDISHCEIRSRSMWEMTYNKAIRHATMLVNNKEVRHSICSTNTKLMFTLVTTQRIYSVQIPASLHQLFELIGAPVQPLSSREDEPQLLRKLLQLARRVPAGCDHDLGVLHAGPTVLIILELQLKI